MKCGFRLFELIVGKPGGGRAHTEFGLNPGDFEGLALGLSLGSGSVVLADALSVQLTGNAKNDLPGGIREL